MRTRLLALACLLPALPLLPPAPAAPQEGAPAPAAERPRYQGPLGLAVEHDGGKAHVALHRAGTVAEVDLRAGKVLREVAVGEGPSDVTRAGGALFVTC